MYKNCINYIKQLFESCDFSLSKLFSPSNINKENLENYKGLFIYYFPSEFLEQYVINIYLNLTNNLPIYQTILFCNQETNKEEIFSFLYRAILCEENILFTIIKPENLDLDSSNYLFKIYNEIYINTPNIKSLLLIVYSSTNSLINQFKKIGKTNLNHIEYKRHNKNLNDLFDIKIYLSDVSGRGKSHKIKNDFKKYENYEYKYFPIGGNISRKNIIDRLQELKGKNVALHIDLIETNKIDLIKNFLFSFLITKCYSLQENIFYFGEEIKIKIEIPVSFENYFQKYSILNNFKIIELNENNKGKLIISDKLNSNIQIVSNYLNKIKFIDEYEITFEKKNNKNQIETEILSANKCEKLIYNEIYKFNKNPTFYQIKSFIDVLANQIKLFSQNFYLSIENVTEKNLKDIRSIILNRIIESTKYIIQNSYKRILEGEIETYEILKGKYDQDEANVKANDILNKRDIVSFKDIKPCFIFINEDKQSFSIITNCEKSHFEYKKLLNFFNSENFNKKDFKDLINYQKLNQEDFIKEIKKVFNNNSSEKQIKNLIQHYVFTEDNFIKLLFILSRIRAKMPIILMGETGCGKTSLIRQISSLIEQNNSKDELKLNNYRSEKNYNTIYKKRNIKGINYSQTSEIKSTQIKPTKTNKMIILNIHAGINDDDIINFIKKNDLLEYNYNRNKNDNNKEIWVFFDEINTCNSMGLLSEILCKHTLLGKKIKENVIFIAACNPYRKNKNREYEQIGLIKNIEQKRNRKLVYTVNPLPFSLINFVFDFGGLSLDDEKKYIKSIINSSINIDKNDKYFDVILNLCIEFCCCSQNFIKEKNDSSSVSLREIRRFVILYNWFEKLLNDNYKLIFKEKIHDFYIKIYSVFLSVYMTYIIRIYDKNIRNELKEKLNHEYKKIFKDDNFEHYYNFPMFLSKFILNNIKIGKGIAKNSILLENIFALFVCVNNQIPIFICGKPGCSKSLSVQLLFKAMKGEDSESKFFKKLPKIYLNSFQGSLNSTSKGVLNVFEKARKIIKNNKNKNIISTVYFDEMGLAEISKNNPLKVIHSQLEYDENEDKVAFIGISNWTLDASKMNRGIHLSIPEPNENDLQTTAKIIAESFEDEKTNKIYENYFELFQNLVDSYIKYKNYLNEINDGIYKDFHGNRDFYNLIKIAAKKLKHNINNNINFNFNFEQFAFECIERNFGGLEFSIKKFKQFYKNIKNYDEIPNDYDIIRNIKENFSDNSNRYILLISKSSISEILIDSIINNIKKTDYKFFLGSRFEDDINKEEYSVKMLQKIQICMEQGILTVFKNLESIYPSLYDLFNQNFTIIHQQKYARIAVGNSNNKMCEVNNNFKCIILIEQNDVQNQDPPFLNRFEKYLFSFENLLSENLIEKSKEIFDNIKNLIFLNENDNENNNNKNISINLNNNLVFFNLEDIQAIIYKMKIINKIDEEKIEDEILKTLAPILNQDLLAFSKVNKFDEINQIYFDKIKNYYQQSEHNNIKNFISNMKNNKNIIYTFSDILDIFYDYDDFNIENEKFGFINENTIENDIFIQQINSENEIEKIIKNFIKNKDKNLIIFKFLPNDIEHLNHIKFIIENFEREKKYNFNKKAFIFIVYLKRNLFHNNNNNLSNQNLFYFLSDFEQTFIDNLINEKNINIIDLLNLNNKEIFLKLINNKEIFHEIIYEIFSTINYNFINVDKNFDKKNYIENISKEILKNEFLIDILKEKTLDLINEEENIIKKIFYEKNIIDKFDIDFISILLKYVKIIFKEKLNEIIVDYEKDSVLSNILNNKIFNQNELKILFNIYMKKKNKEIFVSLENNKNIVNLILNLNVPGCVLFYKNLINSCNESKIFEEFNENENIIRKKFNNENNNDFISDYKKNKKNFYGRFLNLIDNEYFYEIDENKNKIYQLLFKDFIKIFILKKFENNIENIENFLYYLCELQYNFEKKEGIINDENEFFLIFFLNSYSNVIYLMIKIFLIFTKYLPNLIELLKTNFDKVKIEESFRNPEFKKYTNYLFSKILEDLIYSFLNNLNINNIFDKFEIYEILKDFHESLEKIKLIKIQLNLYLNELCNFNSYIKFIEIINKNNIFSKDLSIEYFKIIKEENEKIKNGDYTSASSFLIEEYNYLFNKIGKFEGFYDFIINLLTEKIIQNDNEDFRAKIFEIILKDKNLIKNSKSIFWLFLKRFNLAPDNNKKDTKEKRVEKFLSFAKNKNKNLKQLNDNSPNNEYLNEILLSVFEIYINTYLIEIKENIYNNELALKFFEKSVKSLINDELNENILINLEKLYSIAYVKCYLIKIIDIIYNNQKKDENEKENLKLTKIKDILVNSGEFQLLM